MDSITVSKFSGSSLYDADRLRKSAEIIRSDLSRRYVVVSAPGKTSGSEAGITDMLYLCHSMFTEGREHKPMLKEIAGRFSKIVDGLGIHFSIDDMTASLERDLFSGKDNGYFASRGEYFMAAIMAEYLGCELVDAAGIIKFDTDGTLNETATCVAASMRLKDTERAVIPGFYGSIQGGKIKTFQRGEGDITGALVARAVNAGMFEKWHYKAEILSADAKIVDDPLPVRNITYREAGELSYVGIPTVHDRALFMLMDAGIPSCVRSVMAPEDPGTLITPELPDGARHNVAVCVAGRRNFSIVHIEKFGVNKEAGFGEKLFRIFAGHGIACEHCLSGIYRMSVVLKSPVFDLRKSAILGEIKSVLNATSVTAEKNLSLIAIVGNGMGTVHGTFRRAFSALEKVQVKVRMIDQGSDDMNIILGVYDEDYNKAIKALYEGMIL